MADTPTKRHLQSLPGSYFDALYASDADPWQFATSDYEREKYAATLACVPCAHYSSGLEIGCSIGVLTRQIATRCDALLALDVAEAALQVGRQRCHDLAHVRFQRAHVPHDWPDQSFELIVLSEVLYYLDQKDLSRLATCVRRSCTDEGDVVLVHWLGETDYPLSGDDAAEMFITMLGFDRILARRDPWYRIDILRSHSACAEGFLEPA